MLRMLSSKPKLPWVCFGDFNELLQVEDKKEGAPRAHNLMQAFRDVLDLCGFVDLGYSGPDYTWQGQHKGELIWERLDRGVANYEWLACVTAPLQLCRYCPLWGPYPSRFCFSPGCAGEKASTH